MTIISFICFLLLIYVAAMRPNHSRLSHFEITRRIEQGDREAKRLSEQESLTGDVVSLQRVVVALLIVTLVILLNFTFGWLLGTIIAVVIALEYGAFARLKPIEATAKKIFKKIEPKVLVFIKKFPIVSKLLRGAHLENEEKQLGSKEELQHLVSESESILSSDEKNLIVHGLSFGDQKVSSIMTPKGMIDSIKKSEFLGPLTLDDLHKIGHSRLPVINGDIDHVVGILYLNSLLALDIKRSTTAEKAMDPKVYYIKQDQTLQHALVAFIKTRHHLFIVVNEFRETVGLITLEDVMEALLGRKIVDEFNAHDNLRAVALRNPRGNNSPQKHTDV